MLEHLSRHEHSTGSLPFVNSTPAASSALRMSASWYLVMGGAPLSALWTTTAEWSLARCASWKGSHPRSFRATLICSPVIIASSDPFAARRAVVCGNSPPLRRPNLPPDQVRSLAALYSTAPVHWPLNTTLLWAVGHDAY